MVTSAPGEELLVRQREREALDAQALPAGGTGGVCDVAEAFLCLVRNGYGIGTVVTMDGGSVLGAARPARAAAPVRAWCAS
jgi:hypothetical protein